MNEASSWSAYERLVMDKLQTLEDELSEVREGVVLLRIDVAQLKIKAGLWGGAFGLIPALVTALVAFSAGG